MRNKLKIKANTKLFVVNGLTHALMPYKAVVTLNYFVGKLGPKYIALLSNIQLHDLVELDGAFVSIVRIY